MLIEIQACLGAARPSEAADPDADNSTGLQSANSSTESLTTTPPKSPTPKTSPRQSKCEEQIFVGNEGGGSTRSRNSILQAVVVLPVAL